MPEKERIQGSQKIISIHALPNVLFNWCIYRGEYIAVSKLRNILLSGAMATTLTACGGGGGGSGVGAVNDFVQQDLSNLSGSSSIVSSYSSLLSTF